MSISGPRPRRRPSRRRPRRRPRRPRRPRRRRQATVELHLDEGLRHVGVADLARGPVHVELDGLVARGGDAPGRAARRRPGRPAPAGSWLRRQCLGSTSGRPTPREDTSSVYAACPIAVEPSSASDTARLADAMSSSSGPRPLGPSPSTTMRTTRRLPAGTTSRASSSSPKPSSTGLTTASIAASLIASRRPSIRLCPAVVCQQRPSCVSDTRTAPEPSEHSEAAHGLGYVRAVPEAPTARWRAAGTSCGSVSRCRSWPGARPPPPSARAPAPPRGGGAPTPGAASPAPAPRVPAAANAEQALSAYAGAVLTGPHRGDLSGDQRRLLTFLRDAHADHAVALAGADPTSRPTTATPSPTRDGAGPGEAEPERLAEAARPAGGGPGRPRTDGSPRRPPGWPRSSPARSPWPPTRTPPRSAPPTPPSVSAKKARKPAAAADRRRRDAAARRPAARRRLRLPAGDRQARRTRARPAGGPSASWPRPGRCSTPRSPSCSSRKADVRAAEPAYAPSSTVQLLRRRRGVWCGACRPGWSRSWGCRWPRPARRAARTQALTLLAGTCRTARAWGAPLQAWPGWPD